MKWTLVRWMTVGWAVALGSAMDAAAADRWLVVNAQPLSEQQMGALESTYRTRLQAGRYWYDRATGWWGLEGGPTLGVVAPGMAVGGVLRADASRGASRVFINGRELHFMEVAYLLTLGPVVPGRYWADAMGNIGYEGRRWPFANLYALAQQRHGDRGPHRSGSGGFNSDGRCSYYQRRDSGGNYIGSSVGC